MIKRLIDLCLAAIGLVATAPLLALAAVGIRLTSPGPVLYRPLRVGQGRRLFVMYKLRTMHVNHGAYRSTITAHADPRVFPFGAFLRRSKIDELPQLLNVLRGEMSIVGPRPEVPAIVDEHYTPLQLETLCVRPGLASPGSIYNLSHGEMLLGADDPEGHYVQRLMPLKLAMDLVYVRRASIPYDAAIIGRAAWVITGSLLGKRRFAAPPEISEATPLAAQGEVMSARTDH